MRAWLVCLVLVSFAMLWLAAARSREICVLSIKRGRLLIMRGGANPSALSALADVIERAGTERGLVRILRDRERARLEASGLDTATLQRARNVIGTYPLPRLLAGQQRGPKNMGQRLGLPWLAWRLREEQTRQERG